VCPSLAWPLCCSTLLYPEYGRRLAEAEAGPWDGGWAELPLPKESNFWVRELMLVARWSRRERGVRLPSGAGIGRRGTGGRVDAEYGVPDAAELYVKLRSRATALGAAV
jgi:hypothetical protein